MKVKDLITELQKYDPDLDVGGSGHFGELLEISYVSLSCEFTTPRFVHIAVEYPGDEPD